MVAIAQFPYFLINCQFSFPAIIMLVNVAVYEC